MAPIVAIHVNYIPVLVIVAVRDAHLRGLAQNVQPVHALVVADVANVPIADEGRLHLPGAFPRLGPVAEIVLDDGSARQALVRAAAGVQVFGHRPLDGRVEMPPQKLARGASEVRDPLRIAGIELTNHHGASGRCRCTLVLAGKLIRPSQS
ncbi:hypothetical protein Mapa_003031 [Marchantia paleacea]|nr:hypothetical protein Mapa_003031 [Marchantia paleacea]